MFFAVHIKPRTQKYELGGPMQKIHLGGPYINHAKMPLMWTMYILSKCANYVDLSYIQQSALHEVHLFVLQNYEICGLQVNPGIKTTPLLRSENRGPNYLLQIFCYKKPSSKTTLLL